MDCSLQEYWTVWISSNISCSSRVQLFKKAHGQCDCDERFPWYDVPVAERLACNIGINIIITSSLYNYRVTFSSFLSDARFPMLIWSVLPNYYWFGHSFLRKKEFRDRSSPEKLKKHQIKKHFAAKQPLVRHLNSANFVDWYAISVKQLHYFKIL